jgi:hypothetical protein
MALDQDRGLVKVFCRVVHKLGHEEVSEMEVPLGAKTAIMSQSQQVAAASTFAKRYAFLNAFGIMTGDEDNDATTDHKEAPKAAPKPAAPVPPKPVGGTIGTEPKAAPSTTQVMEFLTAAKDQKQLDTIYKQALKHSWSDDQAQVLISCYDSCKAKLKPTDQEMANAERSGMSE